MDQSGPGPHQTKQAAGGDSSTESPGTSPSSPSSITVNPNKQDVDASSPVKTDPSAKPEDSSLITVSDTTNSSPPPPPVHKSTKSVSWSDQLVTESTFTPYADPDTPPPGAGSGSDQYADRSVSDSSSTSLKETMDGVRNVLGRWGTNVKQAAKRAESLAGDTWQHLKTSPSMTDAAMGRLAHSTKILAEGGYEKIFRHTFETNPYEQLSSTYACYLSTSAGAMMGVLYISTAKLAFCSDSPLPCKNGDQTEWNYYKVVIPLDQLKAVNPSSSRVDPAEKYIQIISVNGHEFWYMGFLNYDGAVTSLREALLCRDSQV